LKYRLEDRYQRDRSWKKKVSEGSIDLTPFLKDGGFGPIRLTGGHFIHYYVETR
jgi:hypothetical protein